MRRALYFWSSILVAFMILFIWSCFKRPFPIVTRSTKISTKPIGSRPRLNLIIPYYTDTNVERRTELLSSLAWNLKLEAIDRVFLLITCLTVPNGSNATLPFLNDSGFPVQIFLNKASVHFIVRSSNDFTPPFDRLRFGEAVQFANTMIPGEIGIVVNGDILFDATLELVKVFNVLQPQQPFMLSRYDDFGKNHCSNDYEGSHDAFISWFPLPTAAAEATMFEFGTWGLENRIMFELGKLGYESANPCQTIKTWHNHKCGKKNHEMRRVNLNGLSKVVYPSQLALPHM